MVTYLIAALIGLSILAYPAVAGYVTPPTSSPTLPESAVRLGGEVPQQYQVWVTAYSSTPEETDDTPFTTARNTPVRDGIVAANFLPFGTRISIPALFGEKEFVVEDRMHRRKENFVDVWMPTKEDAKQFGIRYATIVVLEQGQETVAVTE